MGNSTGEPKAEIIGVLNKTIDLWLLELKYYTLDQLRIKPSSTDWSMGQVYMHLVEAANYHIEQVKACLSSDQNKLENASPEANVMFLNDSFPDAIIKGPRSNDFTPQPETKQQIIDGLVAIRNELDGPIALMFSTRRFSGKTKHPGLNYFDAKEWLQFSDMHFRHHLRQKKRIDEFLKVKVKR